METAGASPSESASEKLKAASASASEVEGVESSSASQCHSEDVVQEIHLSLVIPYLSWKDIVSCSGVNCMWRAMTDNENLWKNLCLGLYPCVENSCLFKYRSSGFKALFGRLSQGWRYNPVFKHDDVQILLDIRHNGQVIFSECLPYSTNKMLQCFPKSIRLGDYIGVQKPSRARINLLHFMQHSPSHLRKEEQQNITAYVESLSVSLLALRKFDGKFFRLLQGNACLAAWRAAEGTGGWAEGSQDDTTKKDAETGLGESVLPLVVEEVHTVGTLGGDKLNVSFICYANLVASQGPQAFSRLELTDYTFSISCADFDGGDANNSPHFRNHGLRYLHSMFWV